MRKMMTVIASLAIGSAALTVPQMASAKTPARVPAYSCAVLASTIGPSKVWQAQFQGNRPSPMDFFRDHPRMEHYAAAPCFMTQSACQAWLYWIQSDWPLQNNYWPCRKGIPY